MLSFLVMADPDMNVPPPTAVAPPIPEIDYTNPASIASAPPNEIDIAQAISSGNGAYITAAQWSFDPHLSEATDLSTFPNSHQAINGKHGLSLTDLKLGSVTYNGGVITNGVEKLDLKNPQYKGSSITALADGGFSIGKGTSEGKFEHEEKSYDLEEASGPVEVKTPEDSVLSNNAKMETADGEIIASLDDGTEVTKTEDELQISGVGFAGLDEFNRLTALVGSLSENGQVIPGTLQLDDETIQIGDTSLIVEDGTVGSSSVELTGDVVIMEKPPPLDQGDGGLLALSKEADKLVTQYGEIGSNIVRNGGNLDMLSRAGAAAAIMEVADFTELTAAGGEIVQSVLALVPEGPGLVPLTSLENVRVGISGAGPELIVGEQAGSVDVTTKVDPKKLSAGASYKDNNVDVGLTVSVPYQTGSPETRVTVNTDSTALALLQKGKRFGAEIKGKDFSASIVGNVAKPDEIEGQGTWKISKDLKLVASVQSQSIQGMNGVVATAGIRVW